MLWEYVSTIAERAASIAIKKVTAIAFAYEAELGPKKLLYFNK